MMVQWFWFLRLLIRHYTLSEGGPGRGFGWIVMDRDSCRVLKPGAQGP